MRAAVGLRPHSGWAAAVVVGAGPDVLDRHRVPLAEVAPPVQPYHEAAGLDHGAAAALVGRATEVAFATAAKEVGALVGRIRAAGHELVAVGIAAAPGSIREDLPLDLVLAAHGRLHAAEGELFRDALADAATGLGLPVTLLPPREAPAAARRLLGIGGAEAAVALTGLGRSLGPPWTRDHKDATVAALLALEATPRARGAPGATPSEPSRGRSPGAPRRSARARRR
jgi:hypothetical protein